MPFTRARNGRRCVRPGKALRALAAGLFAIALAAGCSSGTHRATGPTTTLIKVDTWTAPAVGGPGTASFCTLVTAVYRHMAQVPFTANKQVRSQFVGDYISTAPAMIASAPPAIASDARLYISSVAQILSALRSAGLDARNLAGGAVGSILVDPNVKAAGNNVISFVQANCHYTIGA